LTLPRANALASSSVIGCVCGSGALLEMAHAFEKQSRCGEMADARDLKSLGTKVPCGFESRHRYGCERGFSFPDYILQFRFVVTAPERKFEIRISKSEENEERKRGISKFETLGRRKTGFFLNGPGSRSEGVIVASLTNLDTTTTHYVRSRGASAPRCCFEPKICGDLWLKLASRRDGRCAFIRGPGLKPHGYDLTLATRGERLSEEATCRS
jgi:hypothetical protein